MRTNFGRPLRRTVATLLLLAGLSGCGSLPAIREDIGAFGHSVHAVAGAQRSLYAAGRRLECDADFYAAAADWAASRAAALPDLAGCVPSVMDDAALAKRLALLDALRLYADKLRAVAGAKDDHALGDAARDGAKQLNTLATTMKLGIDTGAAGGVEAAVIAIANFVLDRRRFRDARAAAAALDGQVALVVDTLKLENHDYGVALRSALARIQIAMNSALAREKAAGGQSVFRAAEARAALRSVGPFAPPSVAGLASERDPPAIASLNDALEEVKRANHQIATAPNGKIGDAVRDLADRAQQARDDQVALGK